jgi:hypothetical protein
VPVVVPELELEVVPELEAVVVPELEAVVVPELEVVVVPELEAVVVPELELPPPPDPPVADPPPPPHPWLASPAIAIAATAASGPALCQNSLNLASLMHPSNMSSWCRGLAQRSPPKREPTEARTGRPQLRGSVLAGCEESTPQHETRGMTWHLTGEPDRSTGARHRRRLTLRGVASQSLTRLAVSLLIPPA